MPLAKRLAVRSLMGDFMKRSFFLSATLLAASAIASAPAAAAEDLTATFTAIEQKWVDAIVKRDAATLSSILADEWHVQEPSGKRVDKATSLAHLKDTSDVLTKATIHDVHVMQLSPTIAVVQGKEDDVSSLNGKDTSGPGSFTDVFVKRGGKWVAVATQYTKIEKS